MDKKKIFLLLFLLLLVVIVLIYLLSKKRKQTSTSLHDRATDQPENPAPVHSSAKSQDLNQDELSTKENHTEIEFSQEDFVSENKEYITETSQDAEESLTEVSATTEEIEAAEEQEAFQESNTQSTVFYWTPNGKSYHSDANCTSLKRSKTILSGSEAEAAEAGKTTLCSMCKKEADN